MRYQRNKLSCSDIEVIPEPFRALIREFNDPRFLRVLEQITGIKRLLPDPYLTGGGLHLSAPGGVLSPHTDFHYYRGLNLYRRINVLVYLNDGWSQQAGGCLSFYDAQHRAVKTVVPEWGRVVTFRTDYQSIHGFSAPVASCANEEVQRRRDNPMEGARRAGGRHRQGATPCLRRLRRVSLFISILAIIANPNTRVVEYVVENTKKMLANRREARRARTETA
jgi:2OG-Fe(II) oxygenase superfamily